MMGRAPMSSLPINGSDAAAAAEVQPLWARVMIGMPSLLFTLVKLWQAHFSTIA